MEQVIVYHPALSWWAVYNDYELEACYNEDDFKRSMYPDADMRMWSGYGMDAIQARGGLPEYIAPHMLRENT